MSQRMDTPAPPPLVTRAHRPRAAAPRRFQTKPLAADPVSVSTPTTATAPATVAWNPAALTRQLAVAVAVLLLAHLGQFFLLDRSSGPTALFLAQKLDFDAEGSAPAWFAALLLAAAAVLAAAVARRLHRLHRPGYAAMTVAALALGWVSLDESIVFHEASIRPLGKLTGLAEGAFYFSWVVVGIPLTLLLIATVWPTLRRTPARARRWLYAGAGLYLAGALGIEMLSGALLSAGQSWDSGVYFFWVTVEETLEFVGVVAAIHGLSLWLIALNQRPEPATPPND
jgi:hypothetical protein